MNFAIAYAIEPWGLSQRVGISRQEAKKVIEDYYNTYKGVRRYMEEVPVRARQHGYVRSIYGRIRRCPALPIATRISARQRNVKPSTCRFRDGE